MGPGKVPERSGHVEGQAEGLQGDHSPVAVQPYTQHQLDLAVCLAAEVSLVFNRKLLAFKS